MDVYKGTGAFSGIAIGKILYYHKSEYQMRAPESWNSWRIYMKKTA